MAGWRRTEIAKVRDTASASLPLLPTTVVRMTTEGCSAMVRDGQEGCVASGSVSANPGECYLGRPRRQRVG